ncbi:M23 family metallopeptidase [Spirosoma soli]|uniref:M23 family metallopeptidase n=1 Tax=Spirosoma soli TaxID=1770529 RepID=A0ABW5M2E7_9BACT
MAQLYYPLLRNRIRQIISGNYGPQKCRFGQGIRVQINQKTKLPEPRNHNGIDLEANEGTAVFSITDGYLYWRNSRQSGFGLELVLEFEYGGTTLYAQYAHLQSISVAIQSEQGLVFYAGRDTDFCTGYRPLGSVMGRDMIGFTGSSGNARGLPKIEEHLHFGIAKGMSEVLTGWIDPEQVLRRIPG